jgi:ABC-type multidrug transport system ATPase subunit
VQPLLIHTEDLSFYFGHFRVLDKINLAVPEGSIYGFLGPNGAGKTTTIKILLGLLQAGKGKVFLFANDIARNPLFILARTGNTVETPTVYQHLSGRENVDIVRILRNLPREKTHEVLQRVGLWNDADRIAGTYSNGMKQRLSLAIALLGNPDLLILDEPMNGLDPSGIIEIREFLKKINEQLGTTILLSSHILGEIEKLATHIGIIDKGLLKFQGTMNELQNKIQESKTVYINTNDNNEALRLLSTHISQVTINGESLTISVTQDSQIAAAVRLLVGKGLDVYQVKHHRSDLEELFLQVLNE